MKKLLIELLIFIVVFASSCTFVRTNVDDQTQIYEGKVIAIELLFSGKFAGGSRIHFANGTDVRVTSQLILDVGSYYYPIKSLRTIWLF